MHESNDVEAQRLAMWSDERLKQAIEQTQAALGTLTQLRENDVEAHRVAAWSDERLKQAIEQTESALAALKALATEPEHG
jgi:hypothetical protein